MAGRPTSLTPEVQRKVCASLREGNYLETAAGAAGIHRNTLRNWIVRGEKGEEPFAEFLGAVKMAEDAGEKLLLSEIRQGVDAWQARSWIMERRWPNKWGGRVRMTINDEREHLLSKVQRDPELHQRLRDVIGEGDSQASAGPSAH